MAAEGSGAAVVNRKSVVPSKADIMPLLAFALVVLLGISYVASGDGIVVKPHDQLDGEFLTYLLQARHFGATSYGELMNGLSSSGMQMAAPGLLLFYLAFPAEYAFSTAYLFIMVVAYVGLCLLLRTCGVRKWVAALSSLAFALLPFYSVYGLSVMGLPLFFFTVKRLWDQPDKKTLVSAVFASLFQAVFSSLVLSGYVVLLVLLVLCAVSLVGKNKKRALFLFVVMYAMTLCYVVLNFDLISQILGSSGYVSHKSEYELSVWPVTFDSFVEFFFSGHYHAVSFHAYIAWFAMVVSLIGLCLLVWMRVRKGKLGDDAVATVRMWKGLRLLLVLAAGIALFYALFHGSTVTALREGLPGSLKAFQFDRVYWLYPTIWYLALGLSGELALRMLANLRFGSVKLGLAAACLAFLVCLCLTLSMSWMNNKLVTTLEKNLDMPTFARDITWKDFFAEDVFNQIQQDLGVEKADVHVLSIGLYPSIAAYNGWYCLDAYSNNYPLEYKHQFRKIIAGELDADPSLKNYFDGWGNRCYAFTHEFPKSYLIRKTKKEKVIKDPKFDFRAAKEMGCDYVFSAVRIENADDSLELVETYSGESSYYEVWVYRVK